MKDSRSTLLVFLVISSSAASAMAAESSWKFPNLNPFSKKGTEQTARTTPHKSKWQLPKVNLKTPKIDILPKWGQGKTNKPSTWNKFTNGTKNFYDKTKTTLAAPFKGASAKTDRASGNTSRYQHGRTDKRSESKSLFTGWLSPKREEPKRRKAPHEFLKQPRPEF